MGLETDQEAFWRGNFGDEYLTRNRGEALIAALTGNFAKIFAQVGFPPSLIEFGANIGNNLRAIHALAPDAALSAIELNQAAAAELKEWGQCHVFEGSILDFDPPAQWEMALIKGVLIHIAPDRLRDAYRRLYTASSRYICIWEYHNPTPMEMPYRGHAGKLFKRDFAGEMLDLFPDLKLVDYGFVYHRDPTFPNDDSNWFILEKG